VFWCNGRNSEGDGEAGDAGGRAGDCEADPGAGGVRGALARVLGDGGEGVGVAVEAAAVPGPDGVHAGGRAGGGGERRGGGSGGGGGGRVPARGAQRGAQEADRRPGEGGLQILLRRRADRHRVRALLPELLHLSRPGRVLHRGPVRAQAVPRRRLRHHFAQERGAAGQEARRRASGVVRPGLERERHQILRRPRRRRHAGVAHLPPHGRRAPILRSMT
jgi:hypothetical protein